MQNSFCINLTIYCHAVFPRRSLDIAQWSLVKHYAIQYDMITIGDVTLICRMASVPLKYFNGITIYTFIILPSRYIYLLTP